LQLFHFIAAFRAAHFFSQNFRPAMWTYEDKLLSWTGTSELDGPCCFIVGDKHVDYTPERTIKYSYVGVPFCLL